MCDARLEVCYLEGARMSTDIIEWVIAIFRLPFQGPA